MSVSPLESPSSPRLPIPEFSLANEGYSLSSLLDNPISSSGSFDVSQAELECVMPTYDRPLDDYLEMFIQVSPHISSFSNVNLFKSAFIWIMQLICSLQFGYVLLFSPAFPLAALSALLNNKLEVFLHFSLQLRERK